MTHSKIHRPVNLLIFKVASEFAGVMYDTGRSQGMTSVHKNARSYAKANIEKFVPLAIKHLLDLLKPTSGITDYMRNEIWEALNDPDNDPDLMQSKIDVNINNARLDDIVKNFNKNKIKTPVIINQTKAS